MDAVQVALTRRSVMLRLWAGLSITHDRSTTTVSSHQARCDVAVCYAALDYRQVELNDAYVMPETPNAAIHTQVNKPMDTLGSSKWRGKTPGSYQGTLVVYVPTYLSQWITMKAFVSLTLEFRCNEKYSSPSSAVPTLEFDFGQWLTSVVVDNIRQYVADGTNYYVVALCGLFDPAVLSPLFKVTIYSKSAASEGEAFWDGYVNVVVESSLVSARSGGR